MTKQLPVSAIKPIFYNAQDVDQTDLIAQQNADDAVESSIINNQFGYGILPEALTSNVLFDSSTTGGIFLDGYAVSTNVQPSDTNFGNQLSISLTDSKASGNRQVKVCVIGMDFQSNLQYETFYFKSNETQVSRKHFTKILVLLFNDLIGNPQFSFNLGGTLVISEVQAMTLSRDVIMLAQDIQPNLFFRDFFIDPSLSYLSLTALLQAAMPLYDVSALNIYETTLQSPLTLNAGDVTTQIGQKFQSTTNNIQKVTLLLSVHEDTPSWTGDLVISIYPLQTSIDYPTDFVPNLPIDFSPYNVPLAQISYNYTTLRAFGIVLDTEPQPVDFVFSNTPLAAGNVIVAGQYYAITLKRSGSNNVGTIQLTVADSLIDNSRVTIFSPTGNLWVDDTDKDLWFRIWTNAAKVSDGQAYDAGHGVTIPKTTFDMTTQSTIDNQFGMQQFTGNQTFSAVLAAVTQTSDAVPDQRTSEPVNSRQQYVPSVTLMDTIDTTNLQKTSEPLILGTISDANIKLFDPGQADGYFPLYSATIVNDDLIVKVVDDLTDTYRHNGLISGLASNVANGQYTNAEILVDGYTYRIANAAVESMIVGDVNGDGVIDDSDVSLLHSFLGYNLNVGLPYQISIIAGSGTSTTFPNGYYGYQTLISPFVANTSIHYQLVDLANGGLVISDGYGSIVPNPNDPSVAYFTSTTSSVAFSTIIGTSSYNLVLFDTSNAYANYGAWTITGIDSTTSPGILTINKIYLTDATMEQILRADIDGDFVITQNDEHLLQSYVDRSSSAISTITSGYPAPTTDPFTKIGTHFTVIKFRLEQFQDRSDDYWDDAGIRSQVIHSVQNIVAIDYVNSNNICNYVFSTTPMMINTSEQISWEPSLVVASSRQKLVPAAFTSETGFVQNLCSIEGVTVTTYPNVTEFDPGRVDLFAPNNIIIGDGGELHRPDGDFYKVDFEIGTIVLEIPDGFYGTEKTIDLMTDFVATTTDNGVYTGITNLGFKALRFSDCSFVTLDALANDQIRFSVAVQSFSPNTNGLSVDGYAGAIVDGQIGVNIDFVSGLLTLNFNNLYQDTILQTLSTKIQISVFLKKGGFNNAPLFVDSEKMSNMLTLISTFSGADVGSPTAIPSTQVAYTPAVDGYWTTIPTSVQAALDELAAEMAGGGSGGGGFTAGGDLSGTATNQTVESIQGVVISGTPSVGNILVASSATTANWEVTFGLIEIDAIDGFNDMSDASNMYALNITNRSSVTGQFDVGIATPGAGIAFAITISNNTGYTAQVGYINTSGGSLYGPPYVLVPPGKSVAVYGDGTNVFTAGSIRAPIIAPLILDTSNFEPMLVAPVAVNQTSAQIVSVQTTNATPIAALTIPLPGTANNPITLSGTNTGLMTLDVSVRMQSTTTADAAWFKLSWAWSVLASGSPVALGTAPSTALAIRTSGVIPTDWQAIIALDTGFTNAIVSITGDASLVVDCSIQAEWNNLQ